MNQIIIIGCGPSGMMAAISAARAGARVTILEGMKTPGKKLLLTGSGKCNLTNLDPDLSYRYRGYEPEAGIFAKRAIESFGAEDTIRFFEEIGLFTQNRNGYLYPVSGQSASVLTILMSELKRLNVKIKFNEKISGIRKTDEIWDVMTESWTYHADKIILCCGSRCFPVTGSDGSGYQLACIAGHTVTPVFPALTALLSNDRFCSDISGIRTNVSIRLQIDAETVMTETGELQGIEGGLSGIVVFQLSSQAVRALHEKKKVTAVIDFLPELSNEKLRQILKSLLTRYSGTPAETLVGLLPGKVITALLKRCRISEKIKNQKLTDEQIESIIQTMKNCRIVITDTRDFDQCQVCTGGVSTRMIDPDTMESTLQQGLFFAGEILDVDGPCGGYNLQWAWSSGYLAGIHAAKQ